MQIALVLLVIFIDHVGLGLVYPLFSSMLFDANSTFIASDLSSYTRGIFLGVLLSAPAITGFFSGPILGAISDQKGRRPVYLFSLMLGILGYSVSILGIFLKSILVLIAARAITGISMGNAAVVSATIVDVSTEGTKTKNFGLYCMAAGIGFATGPFIGGYLSMLGFIVPFCAAALTTCVSLLFMFLFFKETNALQKTGPIRIGQGIRNLKTAFRMSGLKVIFAVVSLFCFGWSLFYEFMPVVWITDYSFSTGQVGFVFAFGSLIFALTSGILIRPIVDRWKPYTILVFSLSIIGLCMLAPLFYPAAPSILLYVALANFFIALVFPTYTTLVSDSVGKNSQGEILGILESIQAAAFGLSPLFAGWVLGLHHHLPPLLGALALFLAAVCLIFNKKFLRVQK